MEKRRQDVRNIKEDIPEPAYDKKLRCFRYGDGSLMDILQIIPKDLVNGDPDMIEMDCITWAKFYKTYGLDLQIVSMMFPCNTQEQQAYWKRIQEKNENPVYEAMIRRKIKELQYRERSTVKKEFFLMCFFGDDEELAAGRKTIDSTFGIRPLERDAGGIFEMTAEIPEAKKRQILFKFCNKNSRIF